jgi:hypothetical protein
MQDALQNASMPIALDHLIVPVHNRRAAAEQLAGILGVPWAEQGVGPFCPVFVSESLTLDFDEAEGEPPVLHYAFHVDDASFDAIVARLQERDIPFRSAPHGPADGKTGFYERGRLVYWNAPGGHVWEALTASYARQRL